MAIRKKRAQAKKINEKMLALRDELWPQLDQNYLWTWQNKLGYTQIPRTFPLILAIMDDLSSGKPVSSTYLALWCRSFSHSFLRIDNPNAIAFESGFQGQRAVSTWKTRIKILLDLGFIDVKEGQIGKYSFILIFNPYLVIKKLKGTHTISPAKYNALLDRAFEIGATDIKG